jgi:hypothetical protein
MRGFFTAFRMTRLSGLEAFAQVFEDDVADEGGDEADDEVGSGEDVVEAGGEGFAGGVGVGELAHQEVGVEEEDDESDFDNGAEDGRERAATRGRGVIGGTPGGRDLEVLRHGFGFGFQAFGGQRGTDCGKSGSQGRWRPGA